jgi:hypothetical protein
MHFPKENNRSQNMQNRKIEIKCRLSELEASTLSKRVKKSGLSRESYLRHLINGLAPTDAPSPDYFAMMKQLHYIGNSLNQVAQKAHVLNVIDTQRYDDAYTHHKQAIITITDAVMLPRKIEWQPPPSGP